MTEQGLPFDRDALVPVQVWAERHGIAGRTATRHAAQGRVPGAVKIGKTWMVPADAIPPYTTPQHMRPVSRTVTGEVVGPPVHDGGDRLPALRPPAEVALPAPPPRYTPEGPLFVTFDDLAAQCEGVVSRARLYRMLNSGIIEGMRVGPPRTPGGRPTWVIPGYELKRWRGDR